MWDGLENAATVAQLAGVDTLVFGLISKIRQAARTARQNRKNCEHLAGRIDMLAELLPRLQQDPEARRTLARLRDALSEAHGLVMSCQGSGVVSHLLTAGRKAERFRDVERKIDSCLSLFPLICHIGVTRRLDGVAMVSPASTRSGLQTTQHHQQLGTDEEFTLAEILVATNNFAVVLSDGDTATVYKGKLHDGQEVAVKRLKPGWRGAEDAYFTELNILSPLRHDHIVRLLGCCAEDGERIVVTQHMSNGSLHDHLHGCIKPQPSFSSPVTASWKTRVQVLLGAARSIEHLHCHAVPLIIHNNVASSNILLGTNWAPRLSNFGASVWRAAGVESQAVEVIAAADAYRYTDPEYYSTGRIKPASDLYSLGVVMLEVLTGKPPVVTGWDERSMSMAPMTLATFALPSIQAGRLVDVLDRRPAPELTSRQLEPLQLVANMAARCVSLHGDNRPAISDVVADLEQALKLTCSHGHF